ncbi:MAG: ComF family protein [Dorea sp.]|nr:ComF family protein [Dorea sp.]
MKITKLLKLFWPEVCPFCGKVSAQGICGECRKKTDRLKVREPKCMKCGKPVKDAEQEYCRDCLDARHEYDRGAALWVHKPPVNTSVYQFKFHNRRSFGSFYAKEMAAEYGEALAGWGIDIIIPVPLYPGKYKKRGYNQAAVLARELGKVLDIPVEERLIKRIRETAPQKNLTPRKRRQNLNGAFSVEKRRRVFLKSRSVLLTDDIYTTGSTVDEAAKTLKKAGAEKVFYLAISIGQGN